ncbi:MAG: hypothetical protein J6R73_03205 [Alistipes sp.]|nr:hypothetical protein [Alistipes sp.]
MKRYWIFGLLAGLLCTGCLKDEEGANRYLIKPLAQYTSGDTGEAIGDFVAYSFAADTTDWGVASYEDAVQGLLTKKQGASIHATTPPMIFGTSELFTSEGEADRYNLPLPETTTMILAVDRQNKLYGYTKQEFKPGIGSLYVTLIFKPWKESRAFKEGMWSFYNDIYAPLPKLTTYIRATAQSVEGGSEEESIANMKIYAFAADTTLWAIRSYDDAVGGVITSKNGPTQVRTTPEYNAYELNEPSTYSMVVDRSPLMLVAVDRTHRRYAYTKQEVDLTDDSPTFSVLFRLWQQQWITHEAGWVVVDPEYAPEAEEENKTEQP